MAVPLHGAAVRRDARGASAARQCRERPGQAAPLLKAAVATVLAAAATWGYRLVHHQRHDRHQATLSAPYTAVEWTIACTPCRDVQSTPQGRPAITMIAR